MVMPSCVLGHHGVADWTASMLFLPERAEPLWPVEVLEHLVPEALFEGGCPGWVVGMRCLLDCHMPLEPHPCRVQQGGALPLHCS
jgi:hypothetical protein